MIIICNPKKHSIWRKAMYYDKDISVYSGVVRKVLGKDRVVPTLGSP